ncbi:NAD(P)-dependent oxidoreductase [Mucilaginibacter phyllosphaerae]|uniref:Phosphoglycerate dehydrogenase-like enzyme n=1 Tax=Mucilaginibacter phyllosphaerae TaxID=1812349 RepID=A0A4Y8AHY9_9SPHI|nr:NAD(P)-dependent oxidoreductase [Mucilaginibacter phyllosphaerae]MBB3968623.1 phosphoglycerate dehydrogenase-like enzyme [Mucilaginibacter phyllosphaerae]TEW67739.1 hypothetical protein E2R65_07055 [Mucilaginibacter phyllosphaerae]GGH14865.1 3-phosphoglycerate dehydrogenase [Mucilaginibacter phyllosphaerae]
MIKIAFAFPEDRLPQFTALVNEYLDESTDTSFHFVSDKEALIALSPEVLITNQYNWVFEYYQGPNQLKWIHFMSAGVDKALEEIAKKPQNGLVVTNVSGIHEECIRNYVFSWILGDAQNLLFNYDNQKANAWVRRQSVSLVNKTILVYGYGSVGRSIGKLARTLGMQVIGVVNQSKQEDTSIKTIVFEQVQQYAAAADYIIVSAPLTAKTRKTLNSDFFNLFTQKPVLINISRAEMVDMNALLLALDNGVIRAAILDVHDTEPLPAESGLWGKQGLFLTPHISGYTNNGMELGMKKLNDLLKCYLSSGIPNHMQVLVNRGY